jgi:hypothetical protein
MLWEERRGSGTFGAEQLPKEFPMLSFDASRLLTALDQDNTLIAVTEMSQTKWLVATIIPEVERQPLKKILASFGIRFQPPFGVGPRKSLTLYEQPKGAFMPETREQNCAAISPGSASYVSRCARLRLNACASLRALRLRIATPGPRPWFA